MREVEERTKGKVNLWPATLYGAIRRMLGAGLIEEAPQALADPEGDARRKYYRIAAKGLEVLGEETGRLAQLVEIAREKDVLGTARPV